MKLILVLAAIALSWQQCYGTCLTTGDPSNENGSSNVTTSTISDAILSYAVKQQKEMASNNEIKHDNIVTSPLSIWAALGLTYLGARSTASDELGALLGVEGLRKDLVGHKALELGNAMLSAGNNISMVSRIAFDKSLQLKQCVVESAAFPISEMDFAGNPEAARHSINNWVANNTNDKIKELLKSGAVSSDTALLILNAMHFKGVWKTPFKSLDLQLAFNNSKGESKDVDMMALYDERLAFLNDATLGVRAVEFNYTDLDHSLVLVQANDPIDEFLQGLTTDKLRSILNGLAITDDVSVRMPKFKIESQYSLKSTLQNMGAGSMFTNIDISGIVEQSPPLKVSDVVHKAYIEVNEEGTEAAAATSIQVNAYSLSGSDLIFNKPFAFVLKHRPTNTILFFGVVRDI